MGINRCVELYSSKVLHLAESSRIQVGEVDLNRTLEGALAGEAVWLR